MKVTRNTDDQLILEDRPWFWAVVFIPITLYFCFHMLAAIFSGDGWRALGASVMVGISLLFLSAFTARSQVIFDRARDQVLIRSRGLFRRKEIALPLQEVERAEVEDCPGSEGPAYRLALVMGAEDQRQTLAELHSGAESGVVRVAVVTRLNEKRQPLTEAYT